MQRCSLRERERERQLIEIYPRDQPTQTVVAFLPTVLMAGGYLGNQVIQEIQKKNLGLIALEIPATTVQSTPEGTRSAMDEAYHLVSNNVRNRQINPEKMIVLGESIGCCQASRFAAEFGTKRLILALPGSKLAECIFESYTTRSEAREAQRRGFYLSDYQRELAIYDPVTYVPHISGRLLFLLRRTIL